MHDRVGAEPLQQLGLERDRPVAGELEMLRAQPDRDRPARLAGLAVERQGQIADRHAARVETAGDQVHRRRADKPGDKHRRRALVEVERRADLVDSAGVHHDEAVGQGHRLDLVVGDIERGGAELLLQPLDLDPHLHPQLGVEVRQRLVEQKHLGVAHDRAAHCDALALPARELARLAVQQLVELQDRGGAPDPLGDLGPRPYGAF